MQGAKFMFLLIGLFALVRCQDLITEDPLEVTLTTDNDIESIATENPLEVGDDEDGEEDGEDEMEDEEMNTLKENALKESEEDIMNQDKEYDGSLNENAPEEGSEADEESEAVPGESEAGKKSGDAPEGSDIPEANFLFGVPADSIPPELQSFLSKKMAKGASNESEKAESLGYRIHPADKSDLESEPKGETEEAEKRLAGHYPAPDVADVLTHNCTVIDTKRSADIGIPRLEQRFETVQLKLKKITHKKYCYQSVSTICKETYTHVDNEICKYSYKTEHKQSFINSVKVQYKKKADTKWVTVCKHTYSQKLGYGNGYGQPVCKEVSQRIAFNTPILAPDTIPVHVSYPVPIKKCVNKPIILPAIECDTKTEERCIRVPAVEEEIREIQVSHYHLGKPKLAPVVLTLPQQVCAEIVKAY